MAAAFFNRYADDRLASAISAGTEPADRVHDCVIKAMSDVGINLGGSLPQLLTSDLIHETDLLITMGCGESCPVAPGIRREDWPLADPKGKRDSEVCEIRDEIKTRVLRLLHELNVLDKSISIR